MVSSRVAGLTCPRGVARGVTVGPIAALFLSLDLKEFDISEVCVRQRRRPGFCSFVRLFFPSLFSGVCTIFFFSGIVSPADDAGWLPRPVVDIVPLRFGVLVVLRTCFIPSARFSSLFCDRWLAFQENELM